MKVITWGSAGESRDSYLQLEFMKAGVLPLDPALTSSYWVPLLAALNYWSYAARVKTFVFPSTSAPYPKPGDGTRLALEWLGIGWTVLVHYMMLSMVGGRML